MNPKIELKIIQIFLTSDEKISNSAREETRAAQQGPNRGGH
jgi:hypothetical protein